MSNEKCHLRVLRVASLLVALGFVLAGAFSAPAAPAPAGTNAFIPQPLSLADAVNLALRRSPNIRRAQKDIEATQGVVIQTRAKIGRAHV